MEWKPYLRKAQFYETDSMGVVYHGNYIHWMEEARTDFLEQIGWGYERATAAGIDFALTDISCSYKKTTKFGQTLAIEMKVRKLTPARLVLEYRMTDPAGAGVPDDRCGDRGAPHPGDLYPFLL